MLTISARVAPMHGPAQTYSIASMENMHAPERAQLATLMKENKLSDEQIAQLFNDLPPENCHYFFGDPVVQRKLVKGIMMGTVMHPFLMQGMQACTPCIETGMQACIPWMARNHQTRIVQDKLGCMLQILPNRPQAAFVLRFFTHISPEAQLSIAQAVWDMECTYHPIALKAVFENLTIFSDAKAQQKIAQAICGWDFEIDLDVLKTLAEKLLVLTDPIAKWEFARAIRLGRFGGNPDVLKAVIKNLHIFTGPEAQAEVARAIWECIFGKDPEVLKALAEKLAEKPLVFTDSNAQGWIVMAIDYGRFGNAIASLELLKEMDGPDGPISKAVDRVVPTMSTPLVISTKDTGKVLCSINPSFDTSKCKLENQVLP